VNLTNKNLTVEYLNNIQEKTPFIIIDLRDVEEKYATLKAELPEIDIFYAVKCNPEQQILETLKKSGSNYEIASIGELHRLQSIDVKPAEIIYSNPVKPADHIEEAHKAGVFRFAFDNAEELEKLARYAPGASVYLRISVSNHGSLINLANKFGANREHAVPLLSLAKDLGLVPHGLAFHVGSQSESLELWDEAFDQSVEILKALEEKGMRLDMLNIGGGFPIRYNDKVPSIQEIAKRIRSNVEGLPYGLQLICEPGRYLVGEAGVIATTIIGKTTRHNIQWAYADVGRFQAFVEMFESNKLHYPIFTSIDQLQTSVPKSLYTVTGPSCDSYDTIERNVDLPTNLQIGDRLYFASAGAYTTVYGAPFNDFEVPKPYFLVGDD